MAGPYLLTLETVQASRRAVAQLKIHPHFVGYLCLRYTARQQRRQSNLKPDFRGFFNDFLSVVPVDRKPYILPFSEKGTDARAHYFNSNVAGSYAPSSLREGKAFLKVIDVAGQGSAASYSLKPRHGTLALQHLLFGERVPALDLAVFLYRNWTLELDNPAGTDLLSVFSEDFGFSSVTDGDENGFTVLFNDVAADVRARSIRFEPAPGAKA